MLNIAIEGKELTLPAQASASIEHVNALFADGIEDSGSLPMEIPTHGNEITLRHVHVLPLAERTLKFADAILGHRGTKLFPGTLHVLSTIKKSVRSTFIIEGFADRLNGISLPDSLADVHIAYPAGAGPTPGYHLVHRLDYAIGGDCQFPMHFNPSLYGDSNPDWYPNASEWSTSSGYAINALVRFKEYVPIEREYIWQCTATTAAGESPTTHPLKWRRTAFGLVNAWDAANFDFHFNTTDGNFYTWVPWFYLKYILKKSLAHIGFTPVGEFMDDTATHEIGLPNTTTIDKPSSAPDTYFFRALQTDPVAFVWTGVPPFYHDGYENFRIPGQNESTGVAQDPNSVWNNSAFTFTLPSGGAGTWKFKMEVTHSRLASPQGPGVGGHFMYFLVIHTASGAIRHLQFVDFGFGLGSTPTVNNGPEGMTVVFDPLEEGDDFHFVAVQSSTSGLTAGTFVAGNVMFPSGLHANEQYLDCDIRGWREEAAPSVNVFEPEGITPSRHVPDVELGAFLVAIADALNLEVVPDVATRTVRFDYKETVAATPQRFTTDHSHRLIGDTEIDHQRRIKGITLAWDLENNEPDPDFDPTAWPIYYSELDLPVPLSLGLRAMIISTRKLLKSAFLNGVFYWKQTGYFVPNVTVGEAAEAREVKPACKPLHMEQMLLDGSPYLVPVLDEEGTSAWFHTAGARDTIYLCEFARAEAGDYSTGLVPSARSWQYAWSEDEISAINLAWDYSVAGRLGLYQRCWQRWLNLLTNAEPVTMDLLVDVPFLLSNAWRRYLHIHSQNYLVERMPVEYGGDRRPLTSRGAYLYRIMPPDRIDVQPPFYVNCPTGYTPFNHVGFDDGETLVLEPYAVPPDGTALGPSRYRVNGGAWIPLTLVDGEQTLIPGFSPGDLVEIEVENSLRPECPPWTGEVTAP